MTDHNCYDYAIHGALARNYHHGIAVEECMKCGKWRAPAYGITEWSPWQTLRDFVREKRGLAAIREVK